MGLQYMHFEKKRAQSLTKAYVSFQGAGTWATQTFTKTETHSGLHFWKSPASAAGQWPWQGMQSGSSRVDQAFSSWLDPSSALLPPTALVVTPLSLCLGPSGPVQSSRSVMSDSLWPHRLQQARLPWPSPTPGAYSNSCHWVSDAI